MNLAALLAKAGRSFGDRPALSLGTAVVADYRGFAGRAAALARGMRERLRLAPGDRAALAMANSPAFMEVLCAAWWAGLVAVPMNAKLHRRELAYILEDAGARACFATAGLAETTAGLEAEIETLERVLIAGGAEYAALFAEAGGPPAGAAPEMPAWLFYTSGTTGRPKGATLSHRNLLMMSLSYYADIDQVGPGDSIIHAAPMSHGSGLYGLPHLARAANHVVPESGGFEPGELLDLIGAWPGASLFAAPTMVGRLVDSPALAGARLDNLKTLVYGGGPMYRADLERALDKLGPRLVQIYGQGETPMTITYLSKAMHAETGHPRYRERLASVGVARTDVEVRVVDEDTNPLGPGAVGTVAVRGEVVMAGYWRSPRATAEAIKDGWLDTGDLGSFDADGFLTLKDRSKDLIISGGTNIYPREVEEVLLSHAGVAEASVVGRPHPDWGEEVVAFVVGRPDAAADAAALDRLCLERIARFKRPRHYRFLEALPKNNYGKVLKTALRAMLEAEA